MKHSFPFPFIQARKHELCESHAEAWSESKLKINIKCGGRGQELGRKIFCCQCNYSLSFLSCARLPHNNPYALLDNLLGTERLLHKLQLASTAKKSSKIFEFSNHFLCSSMSSVIFKSLLNIT